MQLKMRGSRQLVTQAIRAWASERLTAALDRYARHVGRVEVQLHDLNGPRGGLDKECDVMVNLVPSGVVVIHHNGEDLYATISLAADRVKQAVGRHLDWAGIQRPRARGGRRLP